jgi:type IV secretion system protein VirD4
VLLFGPNGKGKGTRILMPNLLQMRGNRSLVVVDPKGELAAVTAPFRRQLGPVIILNPFGVLTHIPGYGDLRSRGFNPLAKLNPDSPSFNREAAQLADALVTVEGKDPHWTTSARALIAAIIMFVCIEARERRTAPTLARVRDLLCQASSDGDPQRGLPPLGIPALAEEMMRSNIAGLRNKAAQFASWNNEIQSIVSAAKIQTESLDDDEMAADLAKDGFDFSELRRRPITVYLILPPEAMDRHAKWLRLVLTSAIQAVLRARAPGAPRVMFMLDEFYALGHLEIISTVWALARGYSVSMMPILQDLNQLKSLYPTIWETFIGMAGAVACFGPNDLTTAEWMSRRAGETSWRVTTQNSGSTSNGIGMDKSTSEGSSTSETRGPLVTPHKLFGMKPGFMLLALDGLSDLVPIYAPPYFDIRQCWLYARDNPYFQS